MNILGIEEITYGVNDVASCKQFFLDWGLKCLEEDKHKLVFETLNGCRVLVLDMQKLSLPPAFEEGPTLREVVWGVSSDGDLDIVRGKLEGQAYYSTTEHCVSCMDPGGMMIRVQLSKKRQIDVQGSASNTWNSNLRIDTPSTIYSHAEPVEVGHVVFFTDQLEAHANFYTELLGFEVSDRYPERGSFLRCGPHGGHHDLFLLALPSKKRGLNHVAFTVRDIHEVFGGGMNVSRQGWETQLGPGRHPVSSAYFWYFKNPAGGLIEYYADEDMLTEDWQPRDFEPGPTVFAEWAIDGGINGHTRRQHNIQVVDSKFLTDTKS
jgi:catechol-2,3-dioxygenase